MSEETSLEESLPRPSFLRHSKWFDARSFPGEVTLVGCGAVGSWYATIGACMGISRWRLFDPDRVEPHNLANQTYKPRHVGALKVEALAEQLREFNPAIQVVTHDEFFVTDQHRELVKGVLVIATDSMKSRMDLTRTFEFNDSISAVIEARLGFDYGEIHCINPASFQHIEFWKRSLKDDSEVPEGPCNMRICTPLVGVVASLMVQYTCVPHAVWRGGGERRPPVEQRFYLEELLHAQETIE